MLFGEVHVTMTDGTIKTTAKWTARRLKKLTDPTALYVYDCTYEAVGLDGEPFEWQGLVKHYYDEGQEMLIARIMLQVWDARYPQQEADPEVKTDASIQAG